MLINRVLNKALWGNYIALAIGPFVGNSLLCIYIVLYRAPCGNAARVRWDYVSLSDPVMTAHRIQTLEIQYPIQSIGKPQGNIIPYIGFYLIQILLNISYLLIFIAFLCWLVTPSPTYGVSGLSPFFCCCSDLYFLIHILIIVLHILSIIVNIELMFVFFY